MRVAWVLRGELTQRTGGTIYDAEVVASLRRAGDEVTVLSLPLPALLDQVRVLAPDVVVGDELCFRELALLFPRLRTSATRRVLLVHHLTRWETELPRRRRRVLGLLESLAMRASDGIVTTSETTRRRLVAEGVTTAAAVALPGADRLMRVALPDAHLSAPSAEVCFTFLGALVPRKRVRELVRAFAEGAGERARLMLVGSTAHDERYVREVRASIAERGLERRVTLLGEVDEAGAAQALAASDVLVMPSSLEGYGIAATEAVFAGVPVIAARAQGLEEALAPCPRACLFTDDERSLTRTLRRFALEPALRNTMRHAAVEARTKLPTWATCATSFRAAMGSEERERRV